MKNKSINLDLLEKVVELANNKSDGHFTLMKFTTNWRVMLGTLDGNNVVEHREQIENTFVGVTADVAISALLEHYGI